MSRQTQFNTTQQQDILALGPSSAKLTVRCRTIQLNTTQVKIAHEMCV